jgi:sulfur relay (sulfurtransferase) complex TusBCD TusD component (DsrE family)
MQRGTRFQYVIVVTRDIIEDGAVPYYYQLSSSLMSNQTKISFFFTREGVRSLRQSENTPQLRFFAKSGFDLWVDPHAAQRRGIHSRNLMSAAKLVSLRAVKLLPKTFVLVDPLVGEPYSINYALHLAGSRGIRAEVFSSNQRRSVMLSRGARSAPHRAASAADWIAQLIEKLEQEELSLIWPDYKPVAEEEETFSFYNEVNP